MSVEEKIAEKQEFTTIRLDADLHRLVKILAAKQRKTVTEVVEAAIRVFLAQQS